MDGQSLGRPAPSEASDQIPIDLDRLNMLNTLQQRSRECAQPRPDLDDSLIVTRRNRIDDRIDDRAIGQEVLAETLARCVFHRSSRRYST
jgi:hypothetical protein